MDAAREYVANLTPEECEQVIQSAARIPAEGCYSIATEPAKAIVRNIERMSDNKGYTGPDADDQRLSQSRHPQ